MIQTLFPNNDAVFLNNNAPTHTAGTVESCFEEHEGEPQHFPGQQPPDLNIEPLWSVLATKSEEQILTYNISKAT